MESSIVPRHTCTVHSRGHIVPIPSFATCSSWCTRETSWAPITMKQRWTWCCGKPRRITRYASTIRMAHSTSTSTSEYRVRRHVYRTAMALISYFTDRKRVQSRRTYWCDCRNSDLIGRSCKRLRVPDGRTTRAAHAVIQLQHGRHPYTRCCANITSTIKHSFQIDPVWTDVERHFFHRRILSRLCGCLSNNEFSMQRRPWFRFRRAVEWAEIDIRSRGRHEWIKESPAVRAARRWNCSCQVLRWFSSDPADVHGAGGQSAFNARESRIDHSGSCPRWITLRFCNAFIETLP